MRRLINLNLATLGVLSALLVGLGASQLMIPAGVVLAAWAAHRYCDTRGRLSVNRWVVNVAVLVTTAVAVFRFSRVGGPPDAAIAADGLIGLFVILLFERKTVRTWWDLFSLSLLLVCLACAFNQGPVFGLVLVVYIFFALSALTLLALHRERTRCAASATDVSGRATDPRRPIDWWRLAGLSVATLIVGPLSLYLRFRSSADEGSEFENDRSLQPARSQLGPTWKRRPWLQVIQREVRTSRAASREYWWRTGRMTFVCLVVGAVVFCLTPRFGGIESMLRGRSRAWNNNNSGPQRMVGFEDRVQLGQLGSVMNDTQRVLAIRFLQPLSDEPYEVQGELYLRGAVLNEYDNGRWEYRLAGDPVFPNFARDLNSATLVRQQIRLDPLDREEVFCVWPMVFLRHDDRLQFSSRLERLLRPGSLRRRVFSCEIGTNAFVAGHQRELNPVEADIDLAAHLQLPGPQLPSLTALANTWLDQSGIPLTDTIGRARALEAQLRGSRRFKYRLGDRQRDESLDPIEDFIVNDPQGHCEYFASTLTLMLRSQGLPARMVLGYKTDEYNYVEKRYWARQSHAHSWVEAFVAPDAIPEELKLADRRVDWSRGGWLRLDPTPSDYDELSFIEYLKRTYTSWRGAIQTAWNQHVMQMSDSRQDALIYRPLVAAVRETLSGLTTGSWSFTEGELDLSSVLSAPWRLIHSPLSLLLVGLTIVGVLIVVVLLVPHLHRGRAVTSSDGRRLVRRRTNMPIGPEFYRKWEAVLQRWGMLREPAQTPREFAEQAGERLADAVQQPQLREAASRLAEVFYEIRFGGGSLDDSESADIEQTLKQVQQAIRKASNRPSG